MGANVEPWWHVPGDRPEPSKFARRALRAIFVDAPDLQAVVEYDPVLPVGMGRRQEGAAEGEGHYHKLVRTSRPPARARTSGENLLLVCFVMAPPSQELEPPANSGRFMVVG